MQLDIDHYIVRKYKTHSEGGEETEEEIHEAVLRIYALNANGNSLMVHVHGFL